MERTIDLANDARLRDALERAQYARIRRQLPTLHAVGIINTLIVAWVALRDGLPVIELLLPGFLIVLSASRLFVLLRRGPSIPEPADRARYLRSAGVVAIICVSIAAAWTVSIYARVGAEHRALLPISLALGCFCIAFCLATLWRTAVGVLAIGVTPSAVAALLSGDPLYGAVFLAIVSAAIVQMRLIAEHSEHLVATLRAETDLAALAHTDDLTRLPNRRAFAAAVEAAILRPGRSAVAIVDLDGFKRVNDVYGHLAGDRYLQEVAARLAATVAAPDSVARLGGDEFALLFRDVRGAEDVLRRAETTLAALSFPCVVEGVEMPMAGSIGAAIIPDDGADLSTILRAADKALYVAKGDGKGQVRLHVAGEGAPTREARTTRLRAA
jgi:diguanylate cyclase (GGDEF)-like protein